MNIQQRNGNIEYKVVDLFAGAGGLSNGFEQTGKFKVIGAVEINNAAVKTYIENHDNNQEIIIRSNNEKVSDITQINFGEFLRNKNIPRDQIIIIGGPPCQGFSNANRQKNYLISGNNQLVKEYVRAIEEIRPVAFLMENVKTMSSEVHKFFVTEHEEDSKFAYSSLTYLQAIMDDCGEKIDNLVREDEILLIDSTNLELEEVFRKIIEFDLKKPIIESKLLISRLRSIERKSRKSTEVRLNKSNEVKEVELLIELLESLLNNNIFSRLNISELIGGSVEILQGIICSNVKSEIIKTKIRPLLDLNEFLLHYKNFMMKG